MTCIIAVEAPILDDAENVVGYEAVLGCDSFLGNSGSRDQTSTPKFFEKGKRFFIAYAGGMRGAQAVEHTLSFRKIKKNEDELHYLVTVVANEVQKTFSNLGINIKTDGSADRSDTLFLICLNGKVFILQNDYSVIRSLHGYAAAGAGESFALGALAALVADNVSAIYSGHKTPVEIVQAALTATEKHNPFVCNPFHIVKV